MTDEKLRSLQRDLGECQARIAELDRAISRGLEVAGQRVADGEALDVAPITALRIERGIAVLATVTHDTTGWQTKTTSLSQLVGDEMYVGVLALKGTTASADARPLWFELDYTMPSYDKGV